VISEDGDFETQVGVDDEFTELVCALVTTRREIGASIHVLALDSDLLVEIPDDRQAWLKEEGVKLVDNGFSAFDIRAVHLSPRLL
jgi:hypothetical protein